MKKKFLPLFILFALICNVSVIVYGQSPTERQNFLPKVIQSSPETAMIQRFGNYKVNLYSGLPDISIPIFEINTGKIRIPIVLSYHASGVKIRDEATWVGLGWNLSAGGSISRVVKGGRADEYLGCINGGYPIRDLGTLDPINNIDDLNYVNNVAKGVIDCEPDIYSLNLPTINSKFYYEDPLILKPKFIPFTSAKLVTTLGTNQLNFNVKDESGVEYILDNERETSLSGSGNTSVVSAWNLMKMISADKTDTISFSYTGNAYQNKGGDYYDVTTIVDMVYNSLGCGSSGNYNGLLSPQTTGYGGQSSIVGSNVPNEIIFPEGKVVFELSAGNRLDFDNKSLKSIKIYKRDPVLGNYLLIKTVNLFVGYFFNGTDRRLRLDSVQVMDKFNLVPETYSFNYDETIAIPSYSNRGRDYWGYYNGQPSNMNLIPYTTVPIGDGTQTFVIGGPQNSREPNPQYNQVGILKRINFPTGGNSEFTYETNKYFDDQTSTVKFGGGLRIKQIKSFDPVSGNANYKTYKYKVSDKNGAADTGYGKIVMPVYLVYYFTEQFHYYAYNITTPSKRIRTYCSNPNVGLEPFDGTIVGYTEIKEINGTEAENAGFSIYKYSFAADQPNSNTYGWNRPSVTSRHFQRGLLLERCDYRINTVGAPSKIHSSVNTYGAFADDPNGAKTLALFERNVYTYQQFINCPTSDLPYPPYFYNTYSVLTGDNRITKNIETVYDDKDPLKELVTTTDYFYDNVIHKLNTRTKVTNSKNEIIETTLRYPHEFLSLAPPANTVPTAMVNANIFNAVIEKEVRLSNTPMSLIHTEYQQAFPGMFNPQFISSKIKAFGTNTEVTFNSYDAKGNILQLTGKDGMISSFVWDYGSNYPVAKVSGAAISQVAFTSFESEGKGNWAITGNRVLDASAPTGKFAFVPASVITRTVGLAGNYLVTYWKKSGTVTVNSISASAIRTANGWSYYEHNVSLTAGGLVSIAASGAVIDELRLFPATAQMNTYTYEPLVGMTSEADPNCRIIYYEYDGFNRLNLIRDQDRNIVRQMCYNYAGQVVNCSIFYNAQQAGIFTKSCAVNFFSSPVSYIVPSGIYSAPTAVQANQLAQIDVAAYGQAYADATGVCVAGITINGYNSKASNYNVRFTNNATSINYVFLLNANTTQLTAKGAIPSGTYTVQFYPQSSSVNATFVINGLTFSGSTQATFNNVSITSTSSAYMY